ncbi:MAG: restriction endonuclease subunit S, partial [Peptostreptococcaceae bacterium]|nr:restriction endonuclease subunit S [Peptostreptococcaceae bacterium]
LLPRMEIQKKIVYYLRKIDEKIELNTQINKNLAA